jgi:saccharopine dehydrogenase (NAD+, L-lysine-forming)
MRAVIVGSGGVGGAAALIAARRECFTSVVMADYDEGRAKAIAESTGDKRFTGVEVDASDPAAIAELLRTSKADTVLNACDPRFVMPIFDAAYETGTTYLDMAMSLSHPNPE